MKTTRRQFIKISSIGAGSLAAVSTPVMNFVTGMFGDEAPIDDTKAERLPNYCEVCFWNCAGWVYKKPNGDIWKIIGNEDDPHSNGRFCPRGTGGVGMYTDNDRLKKPLLRVKEEGKDDTFKEITWDEAYEIAAKRFAEIGDKYGYESLALFKHGKGGAHFDRLFKAFGSKNAAGPAYAQCKGPREEAFQVTFGHALHSPEPLDIRDTKCLVLIGSHLGENMHNGQVQEMSDAIDKNAAIITVDPRFSTAASKSKFWLPIKPSTDIALLLAWMNVIIEEELYDKKYVEKYTYGFEQLKAHVKSFTPEWAHGITTLAPALIRDAAREMAAAAPAVIVHPGRHVTWYGDDTQRLRAVAILNALLGSWGRRGGFFIPAKASLPKYPWPKGPKPKWTWRDIKPGVYPLASSGVTNLLLDASHPDCKSKNKIKGWMVAGTNLPQSMPDRKRTEAAIQNLEFLVVVDTMPSDIVSYADLVLPESTYLERYDDIRVAPHREPNIALRVPAMEPRFESRPGSEIAKGIAEKMGLGKFFPYKDYSEVLDFQLQKMGSSLEEMIQLGVKKLEREYDDIFFLDDEEIEFHTNTGKIELYSTELESLGFDPLPKYKQHRKADPYYYHLIYGRAPMHTFSRTANNPNLTDLMDENKVWINPKVAKEWGIVNDQKIWLQNQDGVISDFPIKVRVTERIRWDSVYMVHGFGGTNKKMSSYGRGASDSQMITNVQIDKETGSTGMRGNFVTFLIDEPKREELKS